MSNEKSSEYHFGLGRQDSTVQVCEVLGEVMVLGHLFVNQTVVVFVKLSLNIIARVGLVWVDLKCQGSRWKASFHSCGGVGFRLAALIPRILRPLL
jgi:hypothetical protein